MELEPRLPLRFPNPSICSQTSMCRELVTKKVRVPFSQLTIILYRKKQVHPHSAASSQQGLKYQRARLKHQAPPKKYTRLRSISPHLQLRRAPSLTFSMSHRSRKMSPWKRRKRMPSQNKNLAAHFRPSVSKALHRPNLRLHSQVLRSPQRVVMISLPC